MKIHYLFILAILLMLVPVFHVLAQTPPVPSAAAVTAVTDASRTSTQVGMSGAMLMIGFMLKKSPIPDWLIPWALTAIATVFYCAQLGWNSREVINGIYAGLGSTGLNQLFRQGKEAIAADPPPPVKTLPLLLALLIPFTFIGCTTASDGTITVAGQHLNPATVEVDIRIVAKNGADLAMQKDPNAKAYFGIVAGVLTAAINDGTYDPEKLKTALTASTANGVNDPKTADIVVDVIELYEANYGDVVKSKLSQPVYLLPILRGIRDGFARAIE